MKLKAVIIVVALAITVSYSYYYYYVETLMFSEIVGYSDNSYINLAISFFDFDTGLTRHDLSNLKKRQSYWLNRLKKIESINDPVKKEQEMAKLTDEMMRDPSMKKIGKLLLKNGYDFADGIINYLE